MSIRVLITYSMASADVQTTFDYLNSFKTLDAEVEYLHVTHGAICDADPQRYDVLINNYCARLNFPDYVSDSYRRFLRAFPGLKVLSVQDEYERTNTLKAAIKEFGFDIVLTCVPQTQVEHVYPRSEFPDVRFATVLTGYVPDGLPELKQEPLPLARRPVVLGYRGRDLGARFGRLAFDKFEIGRRMKELCAARGIPHDIAMDEASRIYGPAWLDFVGSCRAMLGSESGSNVFDPDGSIEQQFRRMAEERGSPPSYAEFLPYVADREGPVEMGQISPRVFECAVLRTPMVLFRGRYSGAIEPEAHYIALEKDFSNADQVLDRLGDLDELQAMEERAFEHLVESGRFGYRPFAAEVRDLVSTALKARRPRPVAAEFAQPDHPGERDRILVSQPTPTPHRRAEFELLQQRLLLLAYHGEVEHVKKDAREAIAAYLRGLDEMEHRLAGHETPPPEPPEAAVLDRIRAFREQLKRSTPDTAASPEKRLKIATARPEAIAREIERFRTRARTLSRKFGELGAEYNKLAESVLMAREARSQRHILLVFRREVEQLEEQTREAIAAYLRGLHEMEHRLGGDGLSPPEPPEDAVLDRLRAFREQLERSSPNAAASPEKALKLEGAKPEAIAREAKRFQARAQALSRSLGELGAEYNKIAESVLAISEMRSRWRLLLAYRSEVEQLEKDARDSVGAYLRGLDEMEHRLRGGEVDAPERPVSEVLDRIRMFRERLAQSGTTTATAPVERLALASATPEAIAQEAEFFRARAQALSAMSTEFGAEYNRIAESILATGEAWRQRRVLLAFRGEVEQLEKDAKEHVSAYLRGLDELEKQLREGGAETLGTAEAAVLDRLLAYRKRLSTFGLDTAPLDPGQTYPADSAEELAREAERFRARAQGLYAALQELSRSYQEIADAISAVGEARRDRQSLRGLISAFREEVAQLEKRQLEEVAAYFRGLDELEQQLRDHKGRPVKASAAVLDRLLAFRERLAEESLDAAQPSDARTEQLAAGPEELARESERVRARAQGLYAVLYELSRDYQKLAGAVSAVRAAARRSRIGGI